jgi:ribonuclease G
MRSILLISAALLERRVALIEDGVTTETMRESAGHERLVGNIYKGRVVRVLPGKQSAFVEVGLDRAAFLYAGDLLRDDVDLGDHETRKVARSSATSTLERSSALATRP